MTVRKNDCALVRVGDCTCHFWFAHCTKKKEGLLVTVDGLAHGELVGMCT